MEDRIIQVFKSAARRGTGEAYLLMKKHPNIDFSKEILNAATRNLAYDPQSEGSRSLYVFGLIQLSVQKEKIRKVILKKLDTERTDTWALVQLFDLATLYAQQGDKTARKVIYKRYGKKS